MDDTVWTAKDWIPIVAAFVGAFCAGIGVFLATEVSAKIARNRERWRQHLNALVHLDYRLNEILCIVADNRYLAKKIQKMEEDIGRVRVTWMELQPLPSVASEYPKLLRMELVNGLFSFQIKLRRHNDDIAQICRVYADMRSAKIRKDIDDDQYATSLGEYVNNASEMLKAYDLIDKYTKELLARIRISNRRDRLLIGSDYFTIPSCFPVTNDEVATEIPILEGEIEKVRATSNQDIKEFIGESAT